MNKEINNNIQEAYCSVEIIKLLQEKGFDVICNKFYNKFPTDGKWSLEDRIFEDCEDYLYAPTLDLAIEWLRVNWNIHIIVGIQFENKVENYSEEFFEYIYWIYNIPEMRKNNENVLPYIETLSTFENGFKTPHEAKETAIKYTLKNLI